MSAFDDEGDMRADLGGGCVGKRVHDVRNDRLNERLVFAFGHYTDHRLRA